MTTPTLAPAVARNRPLSWRAVAHILCALLTVTCIVSTAMIGSILHRGDIIAAQAKRIRQLEETRNSDDYQSMRQGWHLSALADVQAEQLFTTDAARQAYTACLRHPNGQVFAWRELSGAIRLDPILSESYGASNEAGYIFRYGERCKLDDAAIVGIRATTPNGYELETWTSHDNGQNMLNCPLGSHRFRIEDDGDVQRTLIEHCRQTAMAAQNRALAEAMASEPCDR